MARTIETKLTTEDVYGVYGLESVKQRIMEKKHDQQYFQLQEYKNQHYFLFYDKVYVIFR